MSTIHAKSAVDALNRLANLALSARPNLNHGFMRSETAQAIDFALYCERAANGKRRVRELITVQAYDHETQTFQDGRTVPRSQPQRCINLKEIRSCLYSKSVPLRRLEPLSDLKSQRQKCLTVTLSFTSRQPMTL